MTKPITRDQVDAGEESNPRTPAFGDECREFVKKFVAKHGEDLSGVVTGSGESFPPDEESKS